jgi:hypothetical protein
MGKIDEIYIRDTRDQLGRYPNWPVNQKISLGKIGLFYGRKATFEWETDLQSLGINVATPPLQQFMSELYTSENAVSLSFDIDASTGNSKALFDFSKKRSVATQGHEVGHQALDIAQLKSALISKIENGLKWNYEWVIITEIWSANGFTTLISNSKESRTEISATRNIVSGFNVADFNLGLKVTQSRKMGYQGVAERNVQPYFQIHKLTRSHQLRLYGTRTSFWV